MPTRIRIFSVFVSDGIKFVKTADEKIADETIKKTRVFAEQDAEAVAQIFAGLIRDECQVGGHPVQFLRQKTRDDPQSVIVPNARNIGWRDHQQLYHRK
jgi:hypothetical protein